MWFFCMINTILMQCLKIKSLCAFGAKLGKSWMDLAVIPVIKPHTHKLYILRQFTNIVYILILMGLFQKKSYIPSFLTSYIYFLNSHKAFYRMVKYILNKSHKKSLKIPKGWPESVNWRRTDNTKVKRKRTNGQTTIYKTLHRKLIKLSNTKN